MRRVQLTTECNGFNRFARRESWIKTWIPLVALIVTRPAAVSAQTCFVYVDTELTKAPFECVDKVTGDPGCGPPDDCTSVASDEEQTVLAMHTAWHQCFGNFNCSFGGVPFNCDDPPDGRGQRWYAFHRQFEIDFNAWREDPDHDPTTDFGFSKIESLDWCQGMVLPVGYEEGATVDGRVVAAGSPSATTTGCVNGRCPHVAGCGSGTAGRPYTFNGMPMTCPDCEAFPNCLFYPGAGPINCGADSSRCPDDVPVGADGILTLEDFPNVDEIANVLDNYFHVTMHGAIVTADPPNPARNDGRWNGDSNNPLCSPRDPMFWRLHKALDDVVRAWQDQRAVDVILVIDRSGSMSQLDSGGTQTKLQAALEAVELFASMLEVGRDDGQVNRLGVVSFDNTANLHLELMNAEDLGGAGGPLETALDEIANLGPGGCTSLGSGIERALQELCPSGDCNLAGGDEDNDRKAILLLTDGMENQPPCLRSAGAGPGSSCTDECFGDALDFNQLQFTQLCAVGFGNEGSLNGDLLTLVAERQGGIYMQNPNTTCAPGTQPVCNDLKDFFVKAFAQLTDEFLNIDPRGFLAGNQPVTEPIEYTACGDSKITFASGWKTPITPGDLRLVVTAPNGDLVVAGEPGIQASTEPTWDHARVHLPYLGNSSGTWRAHLIRPHEVFVNGFTPDSFVDPETGISIVRRQIQRLCPQGCKSVLYFEAGRKGDSSAYEKALSVEQGTGLIGSVLQTADADEFAGLLEEPWDLIVYAYMDQDVVLPSDFALSDLVCGGQRAIITDTREKNTGALFKCAGAEREADINWETMFGDGRLFDDVVKFANPGHVVMTYGISSVGGADVQATADRDRVGAVVAKTNRGPDQFWFVDILGRGLSKLDPHLVQSTWRTGEDLIATVRILPSYIHAGGYDAVDARVEVEYPTVGLGTLIKDTGLKGETKVGGESLSRRATTLSDMVIPTSTITVPMFDDGTNGDIHPGNAYWTAQLPGIARVDGMYKLRYLLDLTVDGCTTHRELTQSIFVDVGVDGGQSTVEPGGTTTLPNGRLLTNLRLIPVDFLGNLLGPGRFIIDDCGPEEECIIDFDSLIDNEDGSYSIGVQTAPGVGGVRVNAFNAKFDVAIPCDDCPALSEVTVERPLVVEHESITGSIQLNGAAPAAGVGGALVYLKSDRTSVATVPDSVIVPLGARSVEFPITVEHLVEAEATLSPTDTNETFATVTISATYGGTTQAVAFTVSTLPMELEAGRGAAAAAPNACGAGTCGAATLMVLPALFVFLTGMKTYRAKRRRQ